MACLFGPMEVRLQGVPLPRLRSRRGLWLLALLALRVGRSVERSWLAGTLWPDSAEENSLVSLRQTLTDLRRALGPARERLLAFDASLKQGDEASLEEAVKLHQRPLLEDCHEESTTTRLKAGACPWRVDHCNVHRGGRDIQV